MIPRFNISGLLPPGLYDSNWKEFCSRFGINDHRKRLLSGLEKAMENLRKAGSRTIYIDGSFVTEKELPSDYDSCYSTSGLDPTKLDPVFFDFRYNRAAQKVKYYGEFFPLSMIEGITGNIFLDFFQIDKNTGNPKGIIKIDL